MRGRINAVVRLEGPRQPLALRRAVQNSQTVAQPLHRRAGDEDRSLGAYAAPRLSSHATVASNPSPLFGTVLPVFRAGMRLYHRCSSPVPGATAPLSEQRRLLIPATP